MPKPHASRIKEIDEATVSPFSSSKKYCNYDEDREDTRRHEPPEIQTPHRASARRLRQKSVIQSSSDKVPSTDGKKKETEPLPQIPFREKIRIDEKLTSLFKDDMTPKQSVSSPDK